MLFSGAASAAADASRRRRRRPISEPPPRFQDNERAQQSCKIPRISSSTRPILNGPSSRPRSFHPRRRRLQRHTGHLLRLRPPPDPPRRRRPEHRLVQVLPGSQDRRLRHPRGAGRVQGDDGDGEFRRRDGFHGGVPGRDESWKIVPSGFPARKCRLGVLCSG